MFTAMCVCFRCVANSAKPLQEAEENEKEENRSGEKLVDTDEDPKLEDTEDTNNDDNGVNLIAVWQDKVRIVSSCSPIHLFDTLLFVL